MRDALWIAGYIFLALMGIWCALSRAADWIVERVKHD